MWCSVCCSATSCTRLVKLCTHRFFSFFLKTLVQVFLVFRSIFCFRFFDWGTFCKFSSCFFHYSWTWHQKKSVISDITQGELMANYYHFFVHFLSCFFQIPKRTLFLLFSHFFDSCVVMIFNSSRYCNTF